MEDFLMNIMILLVILSIPMTIILTRFYMKYQEMKTKGADGNSGEMRKEIGSLMADNEELKERMKNLEYILTDEKRRINLEYEKEQILLDKQNKT